MLDQTEFYEFLQKIHQWWKLFPNKQIFDTISIILPSYVKAKFLGNVPPFSKNHYFCFVCIKSPFTAIIW